MTTRLRVTAQAENDIADAARWYEEKRQGLGAEFTDQLSAVVATIAESPQRFPRIWSGVRRAPLKRFPYGVYFVISRGVIVVFAVLHLRRRPDAWKRDR